ncbi:U-box domain-containing protein 34 isoform X2 [Populus trichocarpa]|uniref:U-box domain-containing protein 34 isoform X2 n=1 Tax=Populus trichocarpa TaxID=3694 RepID=UPI000D187E5B|nr:U-box domain-containing protein 34 isoform X2 [Populus trichocarpa]|eukprot:XP_024458952.1 U-box domain-containing protein 34 isoform X2 [Populus trichocarpa]
MTVVAVAVTGSEGVGGRGSRRAVRWAAENLSAKAKRLTLVHIVPRITCIPSPCGGDGIVIEELDENVVALYLDEMKMKLEDDIFLPFKKLCKSRVEKVETVVIEDDNPATGLLRYVRESGIDSLVLGSCSSNCFLRKLKGPGVPTTVLKCAPETCNVHVVSRRKIISISATSSASIDSKVEGTFESSSVTNLSHLDPHMGLSMTLDVGSCNSLASRESDQAEVEQLQLELQNTIMMYKRACEELVHTQNKVQLLSLECLEEENKVNAALEREETLKRIAAEEKARYLQAIEEVEEAKDLLAKEANGRQIAERNALNESLEKQKIVDAVFSNDRSYGKVYKCNLDHTPVAVKVFCPDAVNKKQEFLREVEVLTQLHHPHLVLLVGACPDNGCLAYEYLENGSLEESIFCRNGKQSLPWFVRFRIVFEVACGLAFLHNSKPDPIVHRDLKPGNILLDRNYVSKIGDVGLAKLISDVVPDNMTEYRDSILAGTLNYMDPEYQRTGTVRPKSDLYAFGVTVLQVLTARPPGGLILTVENAIMNGSFTDILDKSVKDWPLAETEELAKIALKCSSLRCRDRPDLDAEVLPVLRRLVDVAAASVEVERGNIYAPSHYFCPILQDLMDDPYIAADGFTYEHRAIKAWLDRHNISPVTKLRFQHSILTPNHTLRSAIQEWRSRVIMQVP